MPQPEEGSILTGVTPRLWIGGLAAVVRRHPLRAIGCIWIILAVPLVVNTVEQVDVTAWTSSLRDNLVWGFPLFYNWKFGIDLLLLGGATQGIAGILHALHISEARAIVISWKLWVLLADLLAAECLRRIALHLGYKKITRVVAVLLVSPGALWVAASHGDISVLATASAFAAVLLFLRGHWAAAGAIVGLGAGIEYWPLAVLALPIILAVGDRSRLRSLTAAFGTAILVTAANFAQDLFLPGSASLLSHTVTPTTPLLGRKPHPIYPFSIWNFGLTSIPFKAWAAVFLVLSAAVFVYGLRRARRLDAGGRARAGLVVVGCIIVFSVLLDPESLAQFSFIAMAGLLLMAVAVNASPLLCATPGIAAFSFFTYSSLAISWFPLVGASAGVAFSPGSNHTLVSVEMRTAAVTTALSLCWFLRAWVRDVPRLRERRSAVRVTYAVVVVATAFIAALSAQPVLWSGVISGSDRPLPQYLSHYQFQSANAIVRHRVNRSGRTPLKYYKTAFTTTAWKLHTDARIKPVDSVLVFSGPRLLQRERRRAVRLTRGCSVPFHLRPKLPRPHNPHKRKSKQYKEFEKRHTYLTRYKTFVHLFESHIHDVWVDITLKGPRLPEDSNVEVVAVTGNTSTVRINSQHVSRVAETGASELVVANVSARALFAPGHLSVDLPCPDAAALRKRVSVVPASGTSHIRLNDKRIRFRFGMGPTGYGRGSLPRVIRRIDKFRLLFTPGRVHVSQLGFEWPDSNNWDPPPWLVVASAVALLLAGTGVLLAVRPGAKHRRDEPGPPTTT